MRRRPAQRPPETTPPGRLCRGLARGGRLVLDLVSLPLAPRSGQRRGVALLMVITFIALMSALVVSGFFNSQVSLSISSNIRDELKAQYKARSAINLTRLMLAYQYELERDPMFAEPMRKSNFQLYQIIDLLMEPFKSGGMSLRTSDEAQVVSYDLKGAGTTGLGDESGDYMVEVTPEEGRININRFSESINQVALFDLCMLVTPDQYDPLFDESSEDGLRFERTEVVSSIIDWVDGDSERTLIDQQCMPEGFSGDEDSRYGRRVGRGVQSASYESKNAPLTTLSELHLVNGITDDFMAQFGEALTVYPVDRVNVNIADARVLYAVLCNAVRITGAGAPDPNDPNAAWACRDPNVNAAVLVLALALEGYQQFINNPLNLLSYYLQGEGQVIPGVSPMGTVVPFRRSNEFRAVLAALQGDPSQIQRFVIYSPTAYMLLADPTMLDVLAFNLAGIGFDDQKIYSAITTEGPRIFRVTATGEYNGTVRTVTAVLDFNRPGGRFLYWREN